MMKLNTLPVILAALCMTAAPAFSGALQDWEFNINGTDYYPGAGDTLGSVSGLDSSLFNSTTGLGTLTETFNPAAAGNYYVGAQFFNPVSVPFYNEYGATEGSAAAGQQWEIDIPEYDEVSANLGSGTIIDNLALGALDNMNHVSGTTDNYLNQCGANTSGGTIDPTCNDMVSMAQGFNFSLASNQEEVVTMTFSNTDPGGFNLQDIHPSDGNNATATTLYFQAGAQTITLTSGSGTPEPSSLILSATAAGFMMFLVWRRRRKSAVGGVN